MAMAAFSTTSSISPSAFSLSTSPPHLPRTPILTKCRQATPYSLTTSSSCFYHSHLQGTSRRPVALSIRSSLRVPVRTAATRTDFAKTFVEGGKSTVENSAPTSEHLNHMKKDVLHFVKYHGLGNDFLLVDNRDSFEPKISPTQAIKLCNRNFGVGADGVILAMPGMNGSDYTMQIFNADGSEPEMCGNGIRCMAHFIATLEGIIEPRSYNINTLAGPIIPKLLEDGKVVVDMGPPILEAADVPTKLPPGESGAVVRMPLVVDGRTWLVTCVSMGNPHCITFGEQDGMALDLNSLSLEKIGPHFEHHEVFPARTNTEFVHVLSPSHLQLRVWERGAGATLACGTGACAVVVAAVLEGRAEKNCIVDLPGGPLQIEWREDNHVYMTGPAEVVFEGTAFV